MIDVNELVVWHNSLDLEGYDIPFVKGPEIPEFGDGDRIAVITAQAGPGDDLESAGDWFGWQIRMIARDHEETDLRRAAFVVDSALRFGDWPAIIWGTRVLTVSRAGGQPSPLQEEHERVAYICSYLAHEIT